MLMLYLLLKGNATSRTVDDYSSGLAEMCIPYCTFKGKSDFSESWVTRGGNFVWFGVVRNAAEHLGGEGGLKKDRPSDMKTERLPVTTCPRNLCARAAVKRPCPTPTVTFANLALVLSAVLDLAGSAL